MLTVLGLSLVGLKVGASIIGVWLGLMVCMAAVAGPAVLDRNALKDEFGQCHKDNGDLFAKAAAEKRELTAEEKTQRDARFARMDSIKALVDDHDRNAALAFSKGNADTGTQPGGKPAFDGEQRDGGEQKFDATAYRQALNQFARTGDTTAIQRFAITSGTASGVLVPTNVLPPVDVRRSPNSIRRLMALFGVDPIRMNDASTINLPVANDTANIAATQTEGSATAGTDTAPTFTGTLTLTGSRSDSSKPMWFSNTQVVELRVRRLRVRPAAPPKADRQEAGVGLDDRARQAGTIGKTLASASVLTYAEWLAYEHSLPQEYRDDAGHLLSDTAFPARARAGGQQRPGRSWTWRPPTNSSTRSTGSPSWSTSTSPPSPPPPSSASTPPPSA
jgi:hypothetical protein